MQVLATLALFIGIAIALWVGIWILIALFALGLIMVIWAHLREFLLEKGILNPTPGVPPEGTIIEKDATTTVIEGNYTRVDSNSEKVE